jgi:hypothetical protein
MMRRSSFLQPAVRPLLPFLFVVALSALIPSSAAAAPRYDFKTPGEAAYCRMEFGNRGFDGFRCITPNDGFWMRFVGIRAGAGTNVRVTKGYSPTYKGLRQRTYVLGFGKSFASSDARAIVCTSRRSGLTCRYPATGLSFWLGRYRGYRVYYDKPGFAPHVRPLFRTSYAWCGIDLDTLAPENPVLRCWHPGTGAETSIAHDDADRGGASGRSEQARDFRPKGFGLQQARGTITWRCRSVNAMFAENCGLTSGTAAFTCSISTRLRCTNIRGRGFTLDARGGFTTF